MRVYAWQDCLGHRYLGLSKWRPCSIDSRWDPCKSFCQLAVPMALSSGQFCQLYGALCCICCIRQKIQQRNVHSFIPWQDQGYKGTELSANCCCSSLNASSDCTSPTSPGHLPPEAWPCHAQRTKLWFLEMCCTLYCTHPVLSGSGHTGHQDGLGTVTNRVWKLPSCVPAITMSLLIAITLSSKCHRWAPKHQLPCRSH